MRKSFLFFSVVMVTIFISALAFSSAADAVGFEKEVAGEMLKVDIFGFSQFTAEGGDGVASGSDDDEIRFDFDRVRLGYKLKWGKVFSKLQLDFNRPDLSKDTAGLPDIIKDAIVGYKADDAAKVSLGMFKTPVGMDFNISGMKLDITKRGLEKPLVLERALGVMLSGRKIGPGIGYDVGYFNPTERSSAVSDGAAGEDQAYAARVLFDKDEFHAEVSYGVSENAGGANTEDYTVWDAALSYINAGLTLKGEYIAGSDIRGTNGRDQNVWYIHAGYLVTPMFEPVIRHYQGDDDLSNTDLGNTFIGLNTYLYPKKKHAARVQLNYVLASGDEEKWGGLGGYKDDAYLAQVQVAF
jgi:hypothetical protein